MKETRLRSDMRTEDSKFEEDNKRERLASIAQIEKQRAEIA